MPCGGGRSNLDGGGTTNLGAARRCAHENFPRHRTICDFRALHLKEPSALFVQIDALLARAEATDEAEVAEPKTGSAG